MTSRQISSNKKELFRLAAVLYADDNYRVVPQTSIRKIVESIFVNNGNNPLNLTELSNRIDELYSIRIARDELASIVDKNEGEFFKEDVKNEKIVYSLTPKRLELTQNKVEERGIDHFINQFYEKHEISLDREVYQKLIYTYLYEILVANISGYEKILGEEDFGPITDDSVFTPEEAIEIKRFLNWDNEEKNKAIFDIASSALEYCMLTSNGNHKSVKKSNIDDKVFYLDTNVLFRAIGIDGREEKKRTEDFLDRVNETSSTLIISRYSEKEFFSTINHYLSQIKPYVKKIRSADVLERNGAIVGIFKMFCAWRNGSSNASLKLFESHVKSLFRDLKDRYEIETDYETEIDEENDNLKDYESSLSNYKGGKFNSRIQHDSKLIYTVESKRNRKNINLYDTQYFLISIDRGMRRWDFHRSEDIPVVLTPSQWLAILLRYISRTSDDYKSFISFLDVNEKTSSLSSDKTLAALAGINKYAEDLVDQKHLLSSFIDLRFKEGLNNDEITEAEIEEEAANFARSKVEERLDVVEEKQAEIKEELAVKTEEHRDQRKETQRQKRRADEAEKKAIRLEVNEKVRNWQCPARYLAMPGLILLLVLTALLFFYKGADWNFMNHLLKNVDALESGSLKFISQTLIYSILIGGIYSSVWTIYYFYFDQSKMTEVKNSFRQELEEK